MTAPAQSGRAASRGAATASEVMARESGLSRQLSARQLTMIAIGGAIGTGLFLGSSLAVQLAGPAVLLSYCMGAVIALLLMGALAEMAVAHPTAGSFGVYAEIYLSRWAGFTVRYTYWAAQAIAIGSEATAVAIYCNWWFPGVPGWVWIAGFSGLLVYVNARSVGQFGEFEYWFSMVKVVAIVCFIVFGGLLLAGYVPGTPAVGLRNLTAHGGFLANGIGGAWLALGFVIFSYVGTEIVAVTAGEARDPDRSVPRALHQMLLRLSIFYIGAILVLVALVPWTQLQAGADVTASPFVAVFQAIGIPAAAHVINVVVITAALSSMNCSLYTATRMLFSLARGGYAPAVFGRVSARGAPVPALAATASGLALAVAMALASPDGAYAYLLGVALFGGLFVWFMIFVTHLAFRRAAVAAGRPRSPVQMWGYPYTPLLGAAAVLAIIVTTWWVPGLHGTLAVGIAWLLLLSAVFGLWLRRRAA